MSAIKPATPLTDAARTMADVGKDRLVEMVDAQVAEKLEQDRARLVEALNGALALIAENRQRIGYAAGSPNDKNVRSWKALLRELGEL